MPDGTPLRTVLYVEDNPANLELVERLIARRPELRLLGVADGNLAFARLSAGSHSDGRRPAGIAGPKPWTSYTRTARVSIIALSGVPRDIEKALN